MTVYVCKTCLKTLGCINVQTTHELTCRGHKVTCPCVKKTSWGVQLSSCDIHDNPAKYNNHYIKPKRYCPECLREVFKDFEV